MTRLQLSGAAFCTLISCGIHEEDRLVALPEAGAADRAIAVECFSGRTSSGQPIPLSRIVHELKATASGDVVDVSVVFNREFVDNTYGANAIGWESRDKGHTFKDLYRSDHVELGLFDAAGEEVFRSKLDYLSESPSVPSGFAALGAGGGDGSLITGSADDILSVGSSMDDNLNARGYLLMDSSPATDASYTPNPEFPDWNFWVEYRARLKLSAFGSAGLGGVTMEFVHASPSKFEGANTVEVEEDECPPPGDENDPFPACVRASPEDECLDPGAPKEGGPKGGLDPGTPCASSADCGPGEFCSETGACVGL